jgi:hypothetical protein
MTIDQLKTELREFIALSETITPGAWNTESDWPRIMCGAKQIAQIPQKLTMKNKGPTTPNATFIARYRNISPTMAEMLLAAVEGLERLYDDTEGYADGAPDASGHDRLCNEVSHSAKHQLQQLLKLWEETK